MLKHLNIINEKKNCSLKVRLSYYNYKILIKLNIILSYSKIHYNYY